MGTSALAFLLSSGVSALAGAGSVACSTRAASNDSMVPSEAARAEQRDVARIETLRRFERDLRARTDVRVLPSSETALGADPWAIRRVPGRAARYVGVLRGRAAIVLLDEHLTELARLPAPRSTTGLAVRDDGTIAASGELSSRIGLYVVAPSGDGLVARGEVAVDALGIRDVTFGPDGALAALDANAGRVLWMTASELDGLTLHHKLRSPERALTSFDVCRGGSQLVRTPSAVLVNCAVDHAASIVPIRNGAPIPAERLTLTNDGPFFGLAARERAGKLEVAVGGVEDHPLDRREGSFGFIDSFVYTFHVDLASRKAERVADAEISSLDVVTPKALAFDADDLVVAGYGTTDLITIDPVGQGRAPARSRVRAAPGVRAIERHGDVTVMANPLLDAWMLVDGKSGAPARVVPVPDSASPARSVSSRLGEALVFTTAMAPWNKSLGRLSRFTCETCHFEGTIDGRTHHTGRGDVRATTKPLLGLFNNRPYFSRALDPDLSVLSMNEFRAANAKSEHDPFFALEIGKHPWLTHLGVDVGLAQGGELDGETLRRAFIHFLADFTHRPNPRTVGRSGYTQDEREGAEIFRDRCESCHAAKLAADADGRVPFAQWESFVFAPNAPLVFGDARYERTGIEPTVHDLGARVPSLRRVASKRPYFTNGSAPDLEQVLRDVRVVVGAGDVPSRFFHAKAPVGADGQLTETERSKLRRFLDVL